MDEYGIVANVIETDRVFRKGAKAWLKRYVGFEKMEWIAMSRGSRRIKKISPVWRFSNFRCAWVPEHLRSGDFEWRLYELGSKAEMEKRAAEFGEYADRARAEHPNREFQKTL